MITPYDPPVDPVSILHEDAHIVAVDKPAGLLSVPGRGEHLADCLLTRVNRAEFLAHFCCDACEFWDRCELDTNIWAWLNC